MTTSGGDDERTIVSNTPPADVPTDTTPKKRSPWLWVALGGCLVILCLLAVLLIGFVVVAERGESLISLGGDGETPTAEAISTPTPTQAKATETAEAEPEATPTQTSTKRPATEEVTPDVTKPSTATPRPIRTPTATWTPVSLEPAIGSITFAVGVTEDNQPIDASTSFPSDIEEIHAFFSYESMSDSETWERYWSQDGEEVASGTEIWDAGESGTFDLSLTGGGEPLGSGEWTLEIYVNGALAQTGEFVIEAGATSDATAGPAVSGTYEIAFARWDGSKHDLFIANTDGGGERFLLQRAAGPSWSRDGQYLSIFGEEGVDRQVRDGVEYVVEGITNGILWLKVANFPADITQVEIGQFVREGTGRWTAWAPNGEMVAFDAARGGPDRRIYFLGTNDNQQYSIEIPGSRPRHGAR